MQLSRPYWANRKLLAQFKYSAFSMRQGLKWRFFNILIYDSVSSCGSGLWEGVFCYVEPGRDQVAHWLRKQTWFFDLGGVESML